MSAHWMKTDLQLSSDKYHLVALVLHVLAGKAFPAKQREQRHLQGPHTTGLATSCRPGKLLLHIEIKQRGTNPRLQFLKHPTRVNPSIDVQAALKIGIWGLMLALPRSLSTAFCSSLVVIGPHVAQAATPAASAGLVALVVRAAPVVYAALLVRAAPLACAAVAVCTHATQAQISSATAMVASHPQTNALQILHSIPEEQFFNLKKCKNRTSLLPLCLAELTQARGVPMHVECSYN
eukprot:1160193-Pelagomonas_calceolata.AAC.8